MKKHTPATRYLCYVLGMAVLAFGLTITALTNLGSSPLTAIPLVISKRFPVSFANMTLVMFVLYVAGELLLQKDRKKALPTLLQIPLSIVFTRIMSLIQRFLNISGFPIAARFGFLLLGILCTGIGAAISLKMKILPVPADGFVQVASEKTGKPLGTVKNILDIANVCVAIILSFLLLGKLEGVGIGSILAMLGVGRVIAIYNKIAKNIQI